MYLPANLILIQGSDQIVIERKGICARKNVKRGNDAFLIFIFLPEDSEVLDIKM
jgi:hypothetical protein